MSYYDSLSRIEVSMREYCFLMEDTNKYANDFKVYLPVLMPLFNMEDDVKTWKETFSKEIFLNAPECKVEVTPSMKLQNYLSVHRKRNSWFKMHPDIFNKGTRLLCEIPEKNIRHIRILDDDFDVSRVSKTSSVFVRNPSFEILDKINVGDTVRVSYPIYTRVLSSTVIDNELAPEGLNANNFTFEHGSGGDESVDFLDFVPSGPVKPTRKYCNILSMEAGTGTVISSHEWGLVVSVGGVSRHITPDRILGFNKNAGEYYSYYEDSFNGGA